MAKPCSPRKSLREEAWSSWKKPAPLRSGVEGVIFGRVKGGFTVDITGRCSLPARQPGRYRPIRRRNPVMHIPQPFQILKMDRKRGNIVVSRRAVLRIARRGPQRTARQNRRRQVLEEWSRTSPITGAFIDMGGNRRPAARHRYFMASH